MLDTARENDLTDLLALYAHLHPNDRILTADDPVSDGTTIAEHWQSILANPLLHYVVARPANGSGLIGTCALTIIPNLTRGARPYGLIENVITHSDWRRRGVGTAILRRAQEIAWAAGCYKIMLLTGSKRESTLRFYENAGFLRGDKTGFVARNPAG